jgi:alkanesulfonate monooxygenase SsuD/methylene tetrahydromethanopterin reductase-like flavin-dependent oxidoreductase (luciferase family)
MAAEGPKTQRLAGRIADGVVLSNCLTRERIEIAHENLSSGAAAAGRRLEDIEIWYNAHLVFAPSESEGIDAIASVIAGTANHVFRFTLDGKGLPEELKERVRGLMSEYQSRHHGQPGALNPNNELIAKYGLRQYLAQQGTIAGPAEHCVTRIKEVVAAGAVNLNFGQFDQDRERWARIFADQVLPAFR